MAPAVVTLQAEELSGRSVNAVGELRKTQHERPFGPRRERVHPRTRAQP